jgi:hypothetical protein
VVVSPANWKLPTKLQIDRRLPTIRQRLYGDANKFSDIARANGIDDPDRIQVGQNLSLPVIS